jgi:hypothetical protein
MNWGSIKKLIGESAPLLGTLVAGPAGTAVGGIISSALGVENTPNAVAHAIKSDPQIAVKLREIEYSHKETLEQLVFDTLNAELKDRQDARERNQESHVPAIICLVLTGMVCLGGYAIFYAAIPEDNTTLANLLFGALLAKWGDSIAYHVGANRSSANKTMQGFLAK